jgi:hypothetical protein
MGTEVKRTLTTERVADLYAWAFAWRSSDDAGSTNLSGLRTSNRAEFDTWLAEHDRAVKAEALEEAAGLIQLQRVLRGKHGEWWDGSDSAEQVVVARAAEYRKAGN